MILSERVRYVLENFHAPLKEDLRIVTPLAEKVANVHGDSHPELVRTSRIVSEFATAMRSHLTKEETVLFPLMLELEELSKTGGKPSFHCGSVGNPIRRMESEHGNFDALFSELRNITGGFVPPPDACKSYGALFSLLGKMDAELSSHAKYEEEFLFPEALKIEATCAQ